MKTAPAGEAGAMEAHSSEVNDRRNSASSEPRATYRKTDRRRAVKPSILVDQIEVAKFYANRRKDVVTVTLREFDGQEIVDIRKNFTTPDGMLRPTKKGIALSIRRLPELARAIGKALHRARELNLIDGDAS